MSAYKLSVLMSLYNGEKSDYFDQAMKSIWHDSTLKPDEIVLVIDGPIRKNLQLRVEYWKKNISCLKLIRLEKNVGLGEALRIGLLACTHSIIARMDTDDITQPTRFNKQLSLLARSEELDVIGSWIAEFDDNPQNIIGYRKPPESHVKLSKFSKWRDPVNHMTVMFRKEAVLEAGNYETCLSFEDTWLWARMMMKGAKFYNIQESLVLARAGDNMLSRRRGWVYLKSEIKLLQRLYQIGFLNSLEYTINMLIRIPIRLLPKAIVKNFFRIFLRKKGSS